MTKEIAAFGIGIRRKKGDKVLDVLYAELFLGSNGFCSYFQTDKPITVLTEADIEALKIQLSSSNSLTYKTLLAVKQSEQSSYFTVDLICFCLSDFSSAVESVEEAYFKLQLISQRLASPHSLCLDGMFGKLHNIAWTNKGPILAEDIDEERLTYQFSNNPLVVSHVDKFPYLVNYHYPKGTRVASGSQVRLGAHLGEGTTVMPAGYVNFNAGSKGAAMIEGRVSAGVVIDDHTDVGGGASIMGTLSGGNKDIISIGKKSLLGANAGSGISLGDGCTIAAGLYVYAGMKISLYDENDSPVDASGNSVSEGDNIVKAKNLSGRNYLLFYHDSVSGKVICKPNTKLIELNADLHKN